MLKISKNEMTWEIEGCTCSFIFTIYGCLIMLCGSVLYFVNFSVNNYEFVKPSSSILEISEKSSTSVFSVLLCWKFFAMKSNSIEYFHTYMFQSHCVA